MSAIVPEAVPEKVLHLLAVIAALLVTSALLLWGLVRLRRYVKSSSAQPRGQGWTLGQIRKLYRSGELTYKQYQALRDLLIKGTRKLNAHGRRRRQ